MEKERLTILLSEAKLKTLKKKMHNAAFSFVEPGLPRIAEMVGTEPTVFCEFL
jgi:hypothetical protein